MSLHVRGNAAIDLKRLTTEIAEITEINAVVVLKK
jgi:hypothetical protein